MYWKLAIRSDEISLDVLERDDEKVQQTDVSFHWEYRADCYEKIYNDFWVYAGWDKKVYFHFNLGPMPT